MLRIKTDLNSKLELKEELVSLAEGKLSVSDGGKTIFSVNTAELEKAFIEEGLGICKLVITYKDGKEKEIAYFTKGREKNFGKFSNAVNQYIKYKKVVETTFEEKKPSPPGISTLYWLYGFAAKHKKVLLAGVVLSVITVGLNLIPPYLLKVLIDSVILSQSHPESLFVELTVVLIASYAASTVVSGVQSYALNLAGNKVVTELRSKLFKHAVKLPAIEIDNISTSRIQARLISDTGNTQWLMTYGLSTLITNALTIVGIGVILFLLFPTLAIYVLIPIPFIILLIMSYNKRSDRAYHKSWRRSADLITKINDVVPNYTVVKSATKENFEGSEFDTDLNEFYKTQMAITRMELKYWQPIGFLVALVTVAVWWVGGNLVILGTLQLGVITAFLAYMGMFYGPIQQISNIMPYIQESMTSGQRLKEVFDSSDAPKEPNGTKKPDLKKDIVFKDVNFGYDQLFPVLNGMNATIRKGKVTAIVGKSGAGKSTITKLLIGLYKIDSGDIRFGNVSINDTNMEYLRDRISYVPQDSSFFEDTVSYNILYFSKGKIDLIDMIATAKAVEMHNEIMHLPLCYDNRIKGRGLSLSGGQRQRLAVARALLGSPDIVLLDEITSSLDAVNARKVNNSILRLESDKTMIFVTHDITEIMNSDTVIVLEDGKVAETGSPSELIRKRGKMYEMFKYKLSGRSEKRGKIEKRSLHSFVDELLVSESQVEISEGERKSFISLTYKGKHMKKIVPKKPFPVSNPEFIIFYEGKDKDVLAIRDYTKLDKKSKEVLETTLDTNNFNPAVRAIRSIRITGDGLEWSLGTDKGDMKFVTENRRDIAIRGNYVILIDKFNTPLKIDTRDLDPASLDMLESSV